MELVQLPTHPHLLIPSNMSGSYCVLCRQVAGSSSRVDGYWCTACHVGHFHKECAESPMELNHHPYHPPHPLSLRRLVVSESSDMCNCCGDELGEGHCLICSFIIHLRCAMEPPALEPRPFTYDACGLLLDGPSLPWVCLQCGVMIHRECIDLPRLIRISRHEHRLCYVSSLPPPAHESSSWSCGVCRKVMDSRYSVYSCIKDNCYYAVHSKCATREDVWDGKDLEGVPEESEDVEEPFEIIDDRTIRHFSHEHHLLKLNEDGNGGSFDGNKHCQACALPVRVHLGNIYSCTDCDCDFTLHEKCANLPRKIWYILRPHRLKLETSGTDIKRCDICAQDCCGFVYKCCTEDCRFKVDASCASVSEPFIHKSHPHLLFSASISTSEKACSGCKEGFTFRTLQCMECDFVLCFKCITLPPKIRYKQDRHPDLVLRGGEEEDV
ncbi:PREDICTED: uncharacterized protein LOC104803124 [Tarenaya hassleriana]|uniref:uncharacterized protein LOC104803124 n=1 Tax=Tarenaya hassleriana TaxID=28532 RepID=UPI00053C1D87|nr:PREDICTED: uncharacterized protein LOC104803124 [Tarenaya hassleriana]